jgi:hypothetical protein
MVLHPVHRHCDIIGRGLLLKSGLIALCGADFDDDVDSDEDIE